MTIEQAIKIFKAFSDRTRLNILLLLLESELCVCQMMDILKVEQSLLSHQLNYLRRAGLVQTRKKGRWVFYFIREEYRQMLMPVFTDWFKKELKTFQPKIARADERLTCPVAGPLSRQRKTGKQGYVNRKKTNKKKKT